jgi:hypothetical protein
VIILANSDVYWFPNRSRFLQALAGQRQAGKTTLARQLMKAYRILAMEVKSGPRPATLAGMAAFDKIYALAKKFRIGTGGMSFEEFFSVRVAKFF